MFFTLGFTLMVLGWVAQRASPSWNDIYPSNQEKLGMTLFAIGGVVIAGSILYALASVLP